MKKHTLIIIDMQEEFWTSACSNIQRNIVNLIKKAKEQKYPIIVVEFRDYGPTRKRLLNALAGYPLVKTVYKQGNDGSKPVSNLLKRNKTFDNDTLKICGVNIAYCVGETVKSLSEKFPKKLLHVVRRSCYGQSESNSPDCFPPEFYEKENVKVA